MDTLRQDLFRCRRWTNAQLASELHFAVAIERQDLVGLLVRLGEFARRKLDKSAGYPNIYDYCMRVLHYTRFAAAKRIAAAKAGKRYPSILMMLRTGQMSLAGAAMLHPHLNPKNRRKLLRAARGKTQEEIVRLIAGISPAAPPKRDTIRLIAAGDRAAAILTERTNRPIQRPQSGTSGSEPALALETEQLSVADPASRPLPAETSNTPTATAAAAPVLYSANILMTDQTRVLLLRAQELLRHKVPRGELDSILRLALQALLDRINRDRRKSKKTPKTSSRASGHGFSESNPSKCNRNVPEAVKQAVWERDGGQCAFVASSGVRCPSRAWIEFDHVLPFALGGTSDRVENIRLLCRAHNQFLGEETFGVRAGAAERRPRRAGTA